MQQHEILAWLGNEHTLTDEQIDEFTTAANQIEQQYPDPDDQDEAQVALITAYRLLVEDQEDVVRELSTQLASARLADRLATAGLKQAANQLIDAQLRTEAGFAREVGVDRMTVRAWRGKGAAAVTAASQRLDALGLGLPAEEAERVMREMADRTQTGSTSTMTAHGVSADMATANLRDALLSLGKDE